MGRTSMRRRGGTFAICATARENTAMQQPQYTHYDVIVIGGGPAGSATGTFLARRGYRVLILEALRHPRHHIGESLLPAGMPVLAELGLDMRVMLQHHQAKYGARFFDPQSQRLETFAFGLPSDGIPPAFNVNREEFDTQLKHAAVTSGCEFLEETPVAQAEADRQPICITLTDGTRITADFLVDASGAAAKLTRQQGGVETLPDFGRLAIYTYFSGVPAAHAEERSYLTMHLTEHGWIWLIPLPGDITSVGVVLKKTGLRSGLNPQQQFAAAVAESPTLADRLKPLVALQPYRACAGYSYRCRPLTCRYGLTVGDAGGFLDPIFSSGVFLALMGATRGAQAVAESLNGNTAEPLRQHGQYMAAGLGVFESFVRRFYQRDLVRNLFFSRHQPAAMRTAVTSILAGHVWDQTNPLVAAVGRSEGNSAADVWAATPGAVAT